MNCIQCTLPIYSPEYHYVGVVNLSCDHKIHTLRIKHIKAMFQKDNQFICPLYTCKKASPLGDIERLIPPDCMTINEVNFFRQLYVQPYFSTCSAMENFFVQSSQEIQSIFLEYKSPTENKVFETPSYLVTEAIQKYFHKKV